MTKPPIRYCRDAILARGPWRSPIRSLNPPLRLYRREQDLPKLAALWPEEIADTSRCGRLRLIAKLRTVLRAERRRGLAGHWTYDVARHRQLLAAYREEVWLLRGMLEGSRQPATGSRDLRPRNSN